MMTESQKKKAGDVLCDIGKYMLTVVPFSYFLSDKPSAVWIVIGTAFFGVLFILFGLYTVLKRFLLEGIGIMRTGDKYYGTYLFYFILHAHCSNRIGLGYISIIHYP